MSNVNCSLSLLFLYTFVRTILVTMQWRMLLRHIFSTPRGKIMCSRLLDKFDRDAIGLTSDLHLVKLEDQHLKYLKYHNENCFLLSFLILLMMRLSCSEKFSALSSAFARICSACCNWLQNHLMSFDTLFIFPIYLFVSMPRRYERVGIYGNFLIFLMFFAHL